MLPLVHAATSSLAAAGVLGALGAATLACTTTRLHAKPLSLAQFSPLQAQIWAWRTPDGPATVIPIRI